MREFLPALAADGRGVDARGAPACLELMGVVKGSLRMGIGLRGREGAREGGEGGWGGRVGREGREGG